MNSIVLRANILLLLLVVTTVVFSQKDSVVKKNVTIDDIFNNVDKRMDRFNNDSLMKSLVVLSREDSLLKKAISDYNLFGLAHRKKSLQWNYTSSIIIFWSVITLVFSGIFFAGVQFYVAMKLAKAAPEKPDGLATQFEASMQGIKVNSPVLGVIILVISILFFFLYLKYVYPVMEVF